MNQEWEAAFDSYNDVVKDSMNISLRVLDKALDLCERGDISADNKIKDMDSKLKALKAEDKAFAARLVPGAKLEWRELATIHNKWCAYYDEAKGLLISL